MDRKSLLLVILGTIAAVAALIYILYIRKAVKVVVQASQTFILSSSNPVQTVDITAPLGSTLSITVSISNGAPNSTYTVTLNGNPYTVTTDSSGNGSISLSLQLTGNGTDTLYVTGPGITNFYGLNMNITVTSSSSPSSTTSSTPITSPPSTPSTTVSSPISSPSPMVCYYASPNCTGYLVDYQTSIPLDSSIANTIGLSLAYSTTATNENGSILGYMIWNDSSHGHVTVLYVSQEAFQNANSAVQSSIQNAAPTGPSFSISIDYQTSGTCSAITQIMPSSAIVEVSAFGCMGVAPQSSGTYLVEYNLSPTLSSSCASILANELNNLINQGVGVLGYVIWNGKYDAHVDILFDSSSSFTNLNSQIVNLINNLINLGGFATVFDIDFQASICCNMLTYVVPSSAQILATGGSCQGFPSSIPSNCSPSSTTTGYIVDYVLFVPFNPSVGVDPSAVANALNSYICKGILGYVIWNGTYNGHVTVIYNSQTVFNLLNSQIQSTITNAANDPVNEIGYQNTGSCSSITQVIPSTANVLATGGACQGVTIGSSSTSSTSSSGSTSSSTSTPTPTPSSTSSTTTGYIVDYNLYGLLGGSCASAIANALNSYLNNGILGYVIWNGVYDGHVTVVYASQSAFNNLTNQVQNIINNNSPYASVYNIDYQSAGSCSNVPQVISQLSSSPTVLATGGACQGITIGSSSSSSTSSSGSSSSSTPTPTPTPSSTSSTTTGYIVDYNLYYTISSASASAIANALNSYLNNGILGYVIWNGVYDGHVTVVYASQSAFNQLNSQVQSAICSALNSSGSLSFIYNIDYQAPGSCSTLVSQLNPPSSATTLATGGACQGISV